MFAALRKEIAALAESQRKEFEHLSTAIGDIMRDLDDIKKRLPVRKAGKVRDAARTNR
jgi:hypothetical protein